MHGMDFRDIDRTIAFKRSTGYSTCGVSVANGHKRSTIHTRNSDHIFVNGIDSRDFSAQNRKR